jgi:hypothetical protein
MFRLQYRKMQTAPVIKIKIKTPAPTPIEAISDGDIGVIGLRVTTTTGSHFKNLKKQNLIK